MAELLKPHDDREYEYRIILSKDTVSALVAYVAFESWRQLLVIARRW